MRGSSFGWAKAFPTAALSASGIRVEGESFLSACQNKLPCIFCCQNKTGATFCGRSCKKSLHDDFLRRHYPHQVKGRSWMTSSQPAHTSSPVYLSVTLYTRTSIIAIGERQSPNDYFIWFWGSEASLCSVLPDRFKKTYNHSAWIIPWYWQSRKRGVK